MTKLKIILAAPKKQRAYLISILYLNGKRTTIPAVDPRATGTRGQAADRPTK